MNIDEIKDAIQTILGNPVNDVNVISGAGNGIYSCTDNVDTYIFAMMGASKTSKRTYTQMQGNTKTIIYDAYEESKRNQNKFFLIAPDSSSFLCDDYYIFVELLSKTINKTSSFEINIPTTYASDRIVRVPGKSGGNISYYITYVPAKKGGVRSNEMLKNYLLCFDSRPYSKYVTNILDFLPVNNLTGGVFKMTEKVKWPNNFLIAGAPGTGKSYLLNEKVKDALKKELFMLKKGVEETYSNEEAKKVLDEFAKEMAISPDDVLNHLISERVRRVTFYEDYSYESFVGCYRPHPSKRLDAHKFIVRTNSSITEEIEVDGSVEGNQVLYTYDAGPFIDTYVAAINNPESIYFLVIEEINRARAAAIFGDMFQLLDRNNEGESEYTITPDAALDEYLNQKIDAIPYDGTMKLPKNMYIWATMNNADQGVNPLDSAFKRRWGYLYLDVESSSKDGYISTGRNEEVRWNIFRKHLNEKIMQIATEDKCIGAWYFKDNEIQQIKDYYDADSIEEKRELLNPLADKLLIYLLNDVCRLNPELLFNDGYTNMPSIRRALLAGVDLSDILKIEWEAIKEENAEYLAQADGNVELATGVEENGSNSDDNGHMESEEVASNE